MKTKKNPILEELWHTKDALAKEAGDDVAVLCENTRRWAESHPHSGPVIKDATELRAWIADHEEPQLSSLNEDELPYGDKSEE